jgi:hypothetical protein
MGARLERAMALLEELVALVREIHEELKERRGAPRV